MHLLSVNYHYYRENHKGNGIYPISEKGLERQIDEISKYYQFISQGDLLDKIKNDRWDEGKYCLLTFDDGLKEQVLAYDYLKRKGVPAVFYVSTSPIQNKTVLDVHKLHILRNHLSDGELYQMICDEVGENAICFPDDLDLLYRYDDQEAKKVKYLLNFLLDETVKTKLITKLFNNVVDEEAYSSELYMSVSDIQELSKAGCLGTHTHNHLALATLSSEQIASEIKRSLSFFSEVCGISSVPSISYPYGGPKAVNDTVAEVADKFGFGFGLTMTRGINDVSDFEQPLLLKRVDTNDAPGGKLSSTEYCI